MTNDRFPVVLIWALPASGKSEVLTFLKRLPVGARKGLHLGQDLVEIDDYPRFASYKQIDDERERNKKPRLFTHRENANEGGFLDQNTWDDMDQYLNARFEEQLIRDPLSFTHATIMLECARGGAAGESMPLPHGYQRTLENLDPGILQNAVILYVNVSPEEAQRRNEARFDPRHEYGILSHHVPRNIMRDNYGRDDIGSMARSAEFLGAKGYVAVNQGLIIPIGIFDNENDQTSFVRDSTISEEELARRNVQLYRSLETVLHPLYDRYAKIHP